MSSFTLAFTLSNDPLGQQHIQAQGVQKGHMKNVIGIVDMGWIS